MAWFQQRLAYKTAKEMPEKNFISPTATEHHCILVSTNQMFYQFYESPDTSLHSFTTQQVANHRHRLYSTEHKLRKTDNLRYLMQLLIICRSSENTLIVLYSNAIKDCLPSKLQQHNVRTSSSLYCHVIDYGLGLAALSQSYLQK